MSISKVLVVLVLLSFLSFLAPLFVYGDSVVSEGQILDGINVVRGEEVEGKYSVQPSEVKDGAVYVKFLSQVERENIILSLDGGCSILESITFKPGSEESIEFSVRSIGLTDLNSFKVEEMVGGCDLDVPDNSSSWADEFELNLQMKREDLERLNLPRKDVRLFVFDNSDWKSVEFEKAEGNLEFVKMRYKVSKLPQQILLARDVRNEDRLSLESLLYPALFVASAVSIFVLSKGVKRRYPLVE